MVEGVAQVVTDPSFTDVEPDGVLIAHTTDPSWSSIMYVSAALVTDIGGAMSHAAVVARDAHPASSAPAQRHPRSAAVIGCVSTDPGNRGHPEPQQVKKAAGGLSLAGLVLWS